MRKRKASCCNFYTSFNPISLNDSRWKIEPISVRHVGPDRSSFIRDVLGGDIEADGGKRRMIGWVLKKSQLVISYLDMCRKYYQPSYDAYLESKERLIFWLASYGSNVCMEYTPDLLAGSGYMEQKWDSTQLAAIAVRNYLDRKGERFRGNKPICLRGENRIYPFCEELVPEKVPFISAEEVECPVFKDRVITLEDFHSFCSCLLTYQGPIRTTKDDEIYHEEDPGDEE